MPIRRRTKTRLASCRLLLAALAVAVSGACRAESVGTAKSAGYRIVQAEPLQLDLTALGLTRCTDVLAVSAKRALAACRPKSAEKKTDVGLRVYLLALNDKRPRIISVSQGLGDAYGVKLQQRKNTAALYPNIVLADASAEYAYGIGMFELQSDALRYLGSIDYVLMNADGNPMSALDVTRIHATPDGFKVTFTQDVFAPDRNGEYRQYAAAKTFGTFDGTVLRQVK